MNDVFACPPDSSTAQSSAYKPGERSGSAKTTVRPSPRRYVSGTVSTSRLVACAIGVSGPPKIRNCAEAVAISTSAVKVSVASWGALRSSDALAGVDESIPRCAVAGEARERAGDRGR